HVLLEPVGDLIQEVVGPRKTVRDQINRPPTQGRQARSHRNQGGRRGDAPRVERGKLDFGSRARPSVLIFCFGLRLCRRAGQNRRRHPDQRQKLAPIHAHGLTSLPCTPAYSTSSSAAEESCQNKISRLHPL